MSAIIEISIPNAIRNWLLDTPIAKFFRTLHAFIFKADIISDALKGVQVKDLTNLPDKKVSSIFSRCFFQETLQEYIKSAAESAYHASRKEKLSELITEIDQGNFTEVDFPKYEMFSNDELWKICVIKFEKESLSTISLGQKNIRELLTTSDGKETVLRYLSSVSINESKIATMFAMPAPSPSPSPPQAIESDSEFEIVQNQIISAPALPLIQPRTITYQPHEASSMISTTLIAIFQNDPLVGQLISRKLIPPNLTSYQVKINNNHQTEFTISLSKIQSTKLGSKGTEALIQSHTQEAPESGENYIAALQRKAVNIAKKVAITVAASNMQININSKIHGTTDPGQSKITFSPWDITGTFAGEQRTLTSIEYNPEVSRLTVTLQAKDLPQIQSIWTPEQFLNVFDDLTWPTSRIESVGQDLANG